MPRGRGGGGNQTSRAPPHNSQNTQHKQSNPQSIHKYFTRQSTSDDKNMSNPTSATNVTNDDIALLIQRVETNLGNKIEAFEKTFLGKIEEVEQNCKRMVDEVKGRTNELERAVDFLSREFEGLKKQDDTIPKLLQKIEELEADRKYQEQRSRKYNLIITGIPEACGRGKLRKTLRRLSDAVWQST